MRVDTPGGTAQTCDSYEETIDSRALAFSLIVLFTGCIAIGTGPKSEHTNATLGQQLIDLKTAKDTGAITEVEYKAQKAKLLGQ
jgi:hypothetical protein